MKGKIIYIQLSPLRNYNNWDECDQNSCSIIIIIIMKFQIALKIAF